MSPTRADTLTLHAPPMWWPLAALAVLAPTLLAVHEPPSVTFYNQALAVFGWGVWLAAMGGWPAGGIDRGRHAARVGVQALWAVAVIQAVAAAWAVWRGPLPVGLGWMGGGLTLAAACAVHAGWRTAGQGVASRGLAAAFFAALLAAGVVGAVIGLLQVFAPGLTDGQLLARPSAPGRAVGNLRQPNHLSSLLIMASAAAVWLGASRRAPARAMLALLALFVAGVVLTASRTGMVAVGLLALWGLIDRQLPGRWRLALLACPLLYAATWAGMWWWSSLDTGVAFAAKARLNDGSDISSSRFAIWSNTVSLIADHPWWGVGYGGFNAAWTFTPFPDRPTAFFDHAHNLPLHWAVELGLPLAALLCVLSLVAWGQLVWPLRGRQRPDWPPTVGACALIVSALGVHSMLEYPLWYSHFLLPVAFAFGLGLAAAATEGAAASEPGPARRSTWLRLSGVAIAMAAVWCSVDYRLAADVYAPIDPRVPLAERIDTSQEQPWWGHQADYAEVTSKRLDRPVPPPAAFGHTLMNLIDARLMVAYARSLAAHGHVDEARAVADRLREFRNPMGDAFFAACQDDTAAPRPFQCEPARTPHSWRQLLPDALVQ